MGPSALSWIAGLGAGKKPQKEEREFRKGGSVICTGHGSGDGSGAGKLPSVSSYRAGDETGGLDLWE